MWRIRVGDWRICYAIEADESIVVILTIARRGDVYQPVAKVVTAFDRPCIPAGCVVIDRHIVQICPVMYLSISFSLIYQEI